MTDFSGANKTLRDAQPRQMIDSGDVYGKLRFAFDKFDLAVEGDGTALVGADTIKLMTIPKGARVVGLEINSEDLGGTGTMKAGYAVSEDAVEAADDDAFGALIDFSGAHAHFRLGDDADAAGINKVFDADVEVTLIPDADFSGTTGLIEVTLTYVVE